jgi:lipoate-protein ligase A
MSEWFFLGNQKPFSAAENMAIDEYLFSLCHQKKCGFFRIYSWDNPTFSYGVSQKIHKAVNLDYIQKNHCSYVRRITGGKTVLHDDEITYAVVSSEDVFYQKHDLYKSYLLISKVLLKAFEKIGVNAYLSRKRSPGLARSDNPCFSFPTPHEIEIYGKKLVGSAQKRDKQALLQHGSIPITMKYDLYANGSNSNKQVLEQNMITLNEVTHKSRNLLVDSLRTCFEDFVGKRFLSFEFNKNDNKEIIKLEKKYQSEEWNFGL